MKKHFGVLQHDRCHHKEGNMQTFCEQLGTVLRQRLQPFDAACWSITIACVTLSRLQMFTVSLVSSDSQNAEAIELARMLTATVHTAKEDEPDKATAAPEAPALTCMLQTQSNGSCCLNSHRCGTNIHSHIVPLQGCSGQASEAYQ